MIPDLENKPLPVRFEHLVKTMSGKRFLAMEGVGNEVPFFICPFHPEETEAMYQAIDNLTIQLQHRGVQVVRINIYDLCIDLLKREEGLWEQVIENEAEYPKDLLLEQFQLLFDAESHLAPAINEKLHDRSYDVLFLEGVGEVYPYVRTHALLENLARHLYTKPLVMFFPGHYKQTLHGGAALRLFEMLPDDKYYRAMNIYRYEP
ncbi:DUF1788 domain-containing protein [Sphaerochaeta sp.]|jgi:hypothetical protein|uniref:DUF1788 domain-containing protein n=1 Tax=Sphaerochaeta sp. TaxID=1972642 RepID=UPI002A3645A8|nr:DUF1788 domain-containing protein [Sphaerochaeta sp.]MDX9985531.1 DUF1788 domain-containing protein [Sphaerochaeta sp.]